MANLILLAGIPGCGKSTWARNFFDLKYRIVSSDEIRLKFFGGLRVAHEPDVKAANNEKVFDRFHREIRESLEHDVDVIADATNLNVRARDELREIGEAIEGTKIHLVLFKNLLEATQRNAARSEDTRVPDQAMEFMVGKYWDCLARIPQESYTTITKIEHFG